MNLQVRRIVGDLLGSKGYYIMQKINGKGRPMYKMYSGNMVPEYYIKPTEFKPIRELVKKDLRGRITLNLSNVRRLHGNTWIKKAYKQSKTK